MYPAAVRVAVGEAPSGPTVEKLTDTPLAIGVVAVMSVEPLRAVVDGVVYVLVMSRFSVTPVPIEPAVWANRPAEIVLNVPVKRTNWYLTKLFCPAAITALGAVYAVVVSSIFFQLTLLVAVLVVPFAGVPVAAPLSSYQAAVDAISVSLLR